MASYIFIRTLPIWSVTEKHRNKIQQNLSKTATLGSLLAIEERWLLWEGRIDGSFNNYKMYFLKKKQNKRNGSIHSSPSGMHINRGGGYGLHVREFHRYTCNYYNSFELLLIVAIMERMFWGMRTHFTGCYCCREVAVVRRFQY